MTLWRDGWPSDYLVIKARDKEIETLTKQRDNLMVALERARDWFETQAKVTSKGGPSSFDLMMLRDERDAIDEVLASVPEK